MAENSPFQPLAERDCSIDGRIVGQRLLTAQLAELIIQYMKCNPGGVTYLWTVSMFVLIRNGYVCSHIASVNL